MPPRLLPPGRNPTPVEPAATRLRGSTANRRSGKFVRVNNENPRTERVGLSDALLAYAVAMILLITLAPFQFATPSRVNPLVVGGLGDAVANVVLFIPPGFLWRLSRPRPSDRWALSALAAGLLLSACVELMQVFLPGRYPAVLDVLTNGAGAMLGALLHDQLRRRVPTETSSARRLTLEQPLMLVLYMLIPLMWLNGLAVVEAPLATLRLLMLGLFGASILAAVQRRYLGPSGYLSRRGATLAALGGYLSGAFPALLVRPVAVLLHGAIVALFCAYLASGKAGRMRTERRFERSALLRAAPFFAAYLLLLPLVTPDSALPGTPVNRIFILEIVQMVAATSVLGFMVAEARGRTSLRYTDSVGWVICWSAVAAGITGVMATAVGTGVLGATRLLVSVAAGVFGGWIYQLQRNRIVRGSATNIPRHRT